MRTGLLTLALLFACFACAGCMWGAGGKASVDAWAVEDSYRHIRIVGNLEVAQQPSAQQLTPLQGLVVIPYYMQYWPTPQIEFLDAMRVDGQHGRLEYPTKLFQVPRNAPLGQGNAAFAGAVVFSEDCWPAAFDTNYSGGPSAASDKVNHQYPVREGFALRLHPVLYKHSRPFDQDVLKASRLAWPIGERLDALIAAVEKSGLSAADRRMVYGQLLEVVSNAMMLKSEESRFAQHEKAAKVLKARLEALGN